MQRLSPKELSLLDQMQRLRYSQGLIETALPILRQSREAQDEMLLFMYEQNPSEKKLLNIWRQFAQPITILENINRVPNNNSYFCKFFERKCCSDDEEVGIMCGCNFDFAIS